MKHSLAHGLWGPLVNFCLLWAFNNGHSPEWPLEWADYSWSAVALVAWLLASLLLDLLVKLGALVGMDLLEGLAHPMVREGDESVAHHPGPSFHGGVARWQVVGGLLELATQLPTGAELGAELLERAAVVVEAAVGRALLATWLLRLHWSAVAAESATHGAGNAGKEHLRVAPKTCGKP